MRILLVDDDREDQNIVSGALQQAGLVVLPVNDGLSGLDMAIADKPDLIIADLHLQGLDITNFVKRIRRRVFLEKTPILLLVPAADYDLLFLQSLGIQAIVNKPIDPVVLTSEVIKQVGSSVKESPSSTALKTEERLRVVEEATEKIVRAFEALEKDDFLHKTILEVVEKVSWEVIPGVIEAALPKAVIQALVERVVWDTVPSLAELAIKKEIQRLQSE